MNKIIAIELIVTALMEGYSLPGDNLQGNLNCICRNIERIHGQFPTPAQIEAEVELFYNNY